MTEKCNSRLLVLGIACIGHDGAGNHIGQTSTSDGGWLDITWAYSPPTPG